MLDPSTIQPRVVLPPQESFDEAKAIVSNYRFRSASYVPSDQAVERARMAWAEERADLAWLTANLPAGTFFEYLGLTLAVVGHVRGKLGDTGPYRDRTWRAVLNYAIAGDLHQEARDVRTLRSMLEPGYVVEYSETGRPL
jgi:hypothetical protein